MSRFPLPAIALCSFLFSSSLSLAQAVRLDVKVLTDAAAESQMPALVRQGTKTEQIAAKLRLEATLVNATRAAMPATVEWMVLGRVTEEGQKAGRGALNDQILMQTSKELVTLKPLTPVKTVFFAFTPGQIRNGARGEGWLVRVLGADGKLLEMKASSSPLIGLARDQAKISALAAKGVSPGDGANPDGEVPLEIVEKIKAEAERNWPGNPDMQAIEIKNKLDYQRSAYKK